MSEVKTTVVTFEEMEALDFIPPATFFYKNAMGELIFIHTSKREVAQEYVDQECGKGKYTVIASRLQKTKSKQEGGGVSVRGKQTMKGQKR